jgi:hypothetical protein
MPTTFGHVRHQDATKRIAKVVVFGRVGVVVAALNEPQPRRQNSTLVHPLFPLFCLHQELEHRPLVFLPIQQQKL